MARVTFTGHLQRFFPDLKEVVGASVGAIIGEVDRAHPSLAAGRCRLVRRSGASTARGVLSKAFSMVLQVSSRSSEQSQGPQWSLSLQVYVFDRAHRPFVHPPLWDELS